MYARTGGRGCGRRPAGEGAEARAVARQRGAAGGAGEGARPRRGGRRADVPRGGGGARPSPATPAGELAGRSF